MDYNQMNQWDQMSCYEDQIEEISRKSGRLVCWDHKAQKVYQLKNGCKFYISPVFHDFECVLVFLDGYLRGFENVG